MSTLSHLPDAYAAALDKIREEISCKTFLEPSADGLYCCPECNSGHGDNRTGAVKYYSDTNKWHCHACKAHGDVVDLYMKEYGTTLAESIYLLAKTINIALEEPAEYKKRETADKAKIERPVNKLIKDGYIKTAPQKNAPENGTEEPTEPPKSYLGYFLECRARITDPAAAAYLAKRGISMKTAHDYGLGYDPQYDEYDYKTKNHIKVPRIIIPALPADTFYVARKIVDEYEEVQKVRNPAGASVVAFNSQALFAPEVREVFITEGAIDALSIIEAGAAAVGLNGAGQWKRDLLNLVSTRREEITATLILAFDNDETGKTQAQKLAEALQPYNISVLKANISGEYHDPNDALVNDRAGFIAAIDKARHEAAHLRGDPDEGAAIELQKIQELAFAEVDSFLEEIQSERYRPIPTGIADIDNVLAGGIMRQQLILLGGAPGAGKTAFASWILENMARNGAECLYINLEMSREQMLARSLSRMAARQGYGINSNQILQGYKWSFEQLTDIGEAAEAYKAEIAPRMHYNPKGMGQDLDGIIKYIRSVAERRKKYNLLAPLVCIDYAQIVRGNTGEDEAAVIKRAMGLLKSFAIDYDTAVILVIAHNRASNKTGAVTMESGRDTSALEYGADLQLGLTFTKCLKGRGATPKDPDSLTDLERKLITMRVTKSRWSPVGKEVDFYFNGETMTITPIEKGREEDYGIYIPPKAGRKL